MLVLQLSNTKLSLRKDIDSLKRAAWLYGSLGVLSDSRLHEAGIQAKVIVESFVQLIVTVT